MALYVYINRRNRHVTVGGARGRRRGESRALKGEVDGAKLA